MRRRDADEEAVELTQCPYDGTKVELETLSGGSALIGCPRCGAAWEWHGAWIRRIREPDRGEVLAERDGAVRSEPEHRG